MSARWRAPNATPAPRQDRDLPDGLRGVREGTQLGGGCGFYFIAPRGGKKETRQQDDAALDEAKRPLTGLTSSNTKRASGARMQRTQPASSRGSETLCRLPP